MNVPPLDDAAMAAAFDSLRRRHGKLDGLAVWLAGIQGTTPPRPLARRRVVAFGGSAGDVAGAGTYADGVALADREVDSGADVFVAVCKPGPATVALVAALTGTEPVDVAARDVHWRRVVGEVRDFLLAHRGAAPLDLAAAAGEPALVGFLAGAARRRTPVVLDGVATAAAALVARAVAPGCEAYFAAGHVTPDPAHRVALDALGLAPLLDLGIRADGGALLALPLLDRAVELLHQDG